MFSRLLIISLESDCQLGDGWAGAEARMLTASLHKT